MTFLDLYERVNKEKFKVFLIIFVEDNNKNTINYLLVTSFKVD